MPTIGHIGRYALKYRLGVGGLGTVYAAHDPLLSRLIAVKTLDVKIDEAEREAFNARFINEARAAGGLSHPHIVTVFDAGIGDGRAYIAMELLKGRDLRQLRQEGWRATPAQAALIVRRVADALAFAHSKGVVHRDIKPANIFMVGRTQPRVLDFGIARIAHAQESADPLSGAGSPHYMAPEQVRREPADRRADVFSLGVVLYELLTDTKPFRGDSLDEIRAAVLEREPAPAHQVDASVPKDLAAIAARAMAKDPGHRFRSARSFARELRQWLDTNPAAGDGESAVKPAASSSRRGIVAGALATVAAAIGAALVWPVPESPSGTPATTARASTSSAVSEEVVRTRSLASAVLPDDAPSAGAPVAGAMPMAPGTTSSRVEAVDEATAARPTANAQSATPSPAASTTASASPMATAKSPVPASPATTATATAQSAKPASLATAATAQSAGPTSLATAKATGSTPTSMAGAARTSTFATAPAGSTAAAGSKTAAGSTNAAGSTTASPRETVKERRAREAREREARDNEVRVTAANKFVAPPTGTVRVAISPWGFVEVDGAASGVAPPLTELRLAEGRHEIVVRNGDFAPFSAAVDVTAGQTITLRHRFGS